MTHFKFFFPRIRLCDFRDVESKFAFSLWPLAYTVVRRPTGRDADSDAVIDLLCIQRKWHSGSLGYDQSRQWTDLFGRPGMYWRWVVVGGLRQRWMGCTWLHPSRGRGCHLWTRSSARFVNWKRLIIRLAHLQCESLILFWSPHLSSVFLSRVRSRKLREIRAKLVVATSSQLLTYFLYLIFTYLNWQTDGLTYRFIVTHPSVSETN